jgi:FSR family fosmidomycin resistance protein-like MFS transporter
MTSESTTPTTAPLPNKQFQIAQVIPIAMGHFFHDIYGSLFPTLLPALIQKLSLSLTQVGSLNAIYQLPALLNPFIGYLADRTNVRYFVILAPGITATALSLMGNAPNYTFLALLLFIAGISSAAFHSPAPAMIGRVSGRKIGLGMSLFMAGGELARTIGPLLAVWAISTWTLEGIYRLMVIGWVSSFILWLQIGKVKVVQAKSGSLRAIRPFLTTLFLPIAVINLFRNFMLEPLTTYLPTYISQGGASLWVAGGALTILELAGVIGALSSGALSDRFGRKRMLIIYTLVPALLLMAFTMVDSAWYIPLLIGLGVTALSGTPIMLAIVQENLPQNRATGNGLFMFVSFLLRPLATIGIGWLGDRFGLQQAYFAGAVLALFSLPAILFLPSNPVESETQTP